LADFGSRSYLQENETVITSFFSVLQPHGSFGGFPLQNYNGNHIRNVRSDHGIRSGSYRGDIASPSYGSRQSQQTIHLVGKSDLSENYRIINEDAEFEGSTCVVVGCSTAGIEGALIDWNRFSKVYFCSRKEDFPVQNINVEHI